MRNPIATLGITLLAFLSVGVAASGPVSSPGGFGGPSSAPARQVDEVYEYGKSIYNGRLPGAQKVKYCVLQDGKPKRVRARTLKPYRGGSKLDLANALYDCAQTEVLALARLDREQVSFVLYFLNKRFKLDLQES